jgi:hypothetical protein
MGAVSEQHTPWTYAVVTDRKGERVDGYTIEGRARENIGYIFDENHARLIAAAPELLEAALSLKAAEDAHANCKCWEDCGPCTKCGARFEDVRDLRGAAITKATGAA